MFTNRIAEHLPSSTQDQAGVEFNSLATLDAQMLSSGYAVVLPLGVPGRSMHSPIPLSLYEVARRAAIEHARQRLVALLDSRRKLIEGVEE